MQNVILTIPGGIERFKAFLLRDHANENLEFWLEVEDYKKSKTENMAAKAQKIYSEFVDENGPKEVGLWNW